MSTVHSQHKSTVSKLKRVKINKLSESTLRAAINVQSKRQENQSIGPTAISGGSADDQNTGSLRCYKHSFLNELLKQGVDVAQLCLRCVTGLSCPNPLNVTAAICPAYGSLLLINNKPSCRAATPILWTVGHRIPMGDIRLYCSHKSDSAPSNISIWNLHHEGLKRKNDYFLTADDVSTNRKAFQLHYASWR
jgi:hypothetical protein